jgi:glutamate racemase
MLSDVDTRPIGLFDSGVGGLTICRAVRRLLPAERLIYLADTAYFPYGARSASELCDRAECIAAHLLRHDCKLIVVACNTASVAALAHLRAAFPRVPFVGVVPVVKVLAEQTRTGTMALLSTPGTAASLYLADLVDRFAPTRQLMNVGCEGLAEAIELEGAESLRTLDLLARYLDPVRASEADVLGLGCTHYSFLRPAIERILGPYVRVYDSSEPVARRVQVLLAERGARTDRAEAAHQFFATGDPLRLGDIASRLLGEAVAAERGAAPIAPLTSR